MEIVLNEKVEKTIKLSDEQENSIKEYCKNNKITVYWDYQDKLSEKQISAILAGKLLDIESDIWENCLDYVSDLEETFLKELISYCDLPDNTDIWQLRDSILDLIEYDYNMNDLYRNTDCNVTIRLMSNYGGLDYAEPEKQEYYNQLKDRGILSQFTNESINKELSNMTGGANLVTFYGRVNVKDLIDTLYYKGELKAWNKLQITQCSYAGLADTFYNGSGSVLELKPVKYPIEIERNWHGEENKEYDYIDISLDTDLQYGINEIYGLVNEDISFNLI